LNKYYITWRIKMTFTKENFSAQHIYHPGNNPLWWPIWAIFGNDNDGWYGDSDWNPTRNTSFMTAVKWWFRNPFHNLVFAVVGWCWVDRTWYKWTVGNWTFALTKYGKLPPIFPYVGYEKLGFIKGYIGWRGGAFGLKLRKNSGQT
jgi:hypothetical protein